MLRMRAARNLLKTSSSKISRISAINHPLWRNNLFRINVKSVIINKALLHTSTVEGAPKETVLNVFDRDAKLRQRERAFNNNAIDNEDNAYFLKDEIGYRVADRVLDIKRDLALAVDVGSGLGHVTRHMSGHCVKKLIAIEMAPSLLENCQMPPEEEGIECSKLLLDEDGSALPFESNSVDLVTSSLSMHWVNNLPLLMSEVNRILKPDGVFIGSVFGGETLFELRSSLQLAGLEREGGLVPHISPFVQVQDLGNLLNRCGFNMITIDSDECKIGFPTMFELLRDLRNMGENNAAWSRCVHLKRDKLIGAAAIYNELYGQDASEGVEPGVTATFQIFYWIGWKPDPSQPKPLKPHMKSDVSLKDLHQLDKVVKEKTEGIIEENDIKPPKS